MKKNLLFLLVICLSCSQKESNSGSDLADELKSQSFEQIKEFIREYEDPEREDWQNPDLVIELLDTLENKIVADIGAGTGYFTFRLAEEAKKVIATEIEEEFLNYLEKKKRAYPSFLTSNIETRLTKENDPGLQEEEVDKMLIVNTYHYFKDRASYLEKLKDTLKPQGTLLIVDYKKVDLPVGPPVDFLLPSNQVVDELKKVGFDVLLTDTTSLNYQYIIKAKKP